MDNNPLISCLMVTKSSYMDIINRAIYSYITQTYENKELIIITDCDLNNLKKLTNLLEKYEKENIKLVYLKTNKKPTVGELRNQSILNASGEYCIQWDDDDLYHKDRIQEQYNALITSGCDYCILKDFMNYFYESHYLTQNKWFNDNMEGLPPSILFKKNIEFKYPDIQFSEDIEIFRYLDLKKHSLLNMPHLYIYTYHGTNAFSYRHHLEISNNTKRPFDIDLINKINYLFKETNLEYKINYHN
jgi:glycosyltransferase involved in cell wall biosynthesis